MAASDDEFDDLEFDDGESRARAARVPEQPRAVVVPVEPAIEVAPAPVKPAAKPAKPAKPAAKRPKDDDDDDDDFDDDDDDDDEETGSMPAMSGGAMSAAARPGPRKLPWIPITVGSTLLVLVLAFAFKDSIFGGADDPEASADPAEGADSAELVEPPAPETKEASPPEPKDETAGEPAPEPAPPAIDPAELETKLAEADSFYRKAKHDKAREVLDGILADAPKEPRALALLAQVLLEKGEFETALTTANDCVKVDAKEPNCWMTIAVIEQENKNFVRALEGFQKYLEIAPDGRFAKSAVKQVARLESKVAG